MRLQLALILLIGLGLLLAGCAGSKETAPDYRPAGVAPSAPATGSQVAPATTPSQPAAPAPSEIAPANPPAPSNDGASTGSPAPSVGPCAGKSGDALTQCQSQAAIAQKDVTVCAGLSNQDSRFRCITTWCASASRDYKQCDSLQNYDDQLACRNKCNPNSNT